MLDHMVERSRLRQSTGEQSKSMKGNWYYQILQMGKEKGDARPVLVTNLVLLVNDVSHRLQANQPLSVLRG